MRTDDARGKDAEDQLGVRNTASAHSIDTLIQAGSVHGGVVGRVYRLTVTLPRSVRVALVLLVVAALTAGGVVAFFTWVAPQFAPTYKTEFLLDLSEADTPSADLAVSAESLRKALGNSGDDDAIALRGFGGECGSPDNTSQLVGFGKDNRAEIGDAVRTAVSSGKSTLLRGIVEATADFSAAFEQDATQVNRIIVITRHGVDSCDDDTAYVEREMRDRVKAAGLAIEFRFVGYQLDDDHRESLTTLATGVDAPKPLLAEDPEQLRATLDWVANVEPALRSAQQVVDIFNAAAAEVNEAAQGTVDGRLDVAEAALSAATPVTADTEFENLRTRAKTPETLQLHTKAVELRARQRRALDAATRLLAAARSGTPLDEQFAAFQQTADDYNAEARAMNQVLAALRAAGPGGTR